MAELFERDCPYYLSIGMTWDQYWNGDVWMVEAFREADKLRQQQRDVDAWLNGLYVMKAVYASVGNMLQGKGKKPIEYPEKPVFVEATREKTEAEKEQEIKNERLRGWANFNAIVENYKATHGEQ